MFTSLAGLRCAPLEIGVGEQDWGARFADLTGNGKADYLCTEVDIRVTGYLNGGLSGSVIQWDDVGQIKLVTGYDRANVRFNDVDGLLPLFSTSISNTLLTML